MIFQDRVEAGQKLAESLKKYQGKEATIFALPRGGVVVGAEIAKRLQIPLDLIIVRKIGHPYNPEYAIGAVTDHGATVFNEEEKAVVDPKWLEEETQKQQEIARQRRTLYSHTTNYILPTTDQIAILVDDGAATGLTMEATIKEVKTKHPQRVVVAVPIIPKETAQEIKSEVDELIALEQPEQFQGSVGSYYKDFPQVSDEEVIKLLNQYHTPEV